MNEIKIGDFLINSSSKPFTIAEAGINHNGDLGTALKMIEAAKIAGVSAIKFFTYQTEEFIIDSKLEYTYKSQGKEIKESMKDMFQRCELSKDDWKQIIHKCDEQNIIFLSTPENVSDLQFLIEFISCFRSSSLFVLSSANTFGVLIFFSALATRDSLSYSSKYPPSS